MTKKKESKEPFDLSEALENVELPQMLVEGLKAYIENNNLKIKSDKDFEKTLKEFKELRL